MADAPTGTPNQLPSLPIDPLAFLITVTRQIEFGLPRTPHEEEVEDRYLICEQPPGVLDQSPLAVDPMPFWGHFGQKMPMQYGEQRYLIIVPTIEQMLHASGGDGYHRLANKFFAEYITFFNQVSLRLQLGDERENTLDHFDRFTPEEQKRAIFLIRRHLAVQLMHYSFLEKVVAEFQSALAADPKHRDPQASRWQQGLQESLQRRGEIEQSVPPRYAMLDKFFWERHEIPTPESGIVIGEFLPKGVAAVEAHPQPAAGAPARVPGIPDNIPHAPPQAVAGRRFAIYEKFGCKVYLRPEVIFAMSDHPYTAHFLRGGKGTLFVWVDSDEANNAAYVFIIRRPGYEDAFPQYQWLFDAQLDKPTLIHEGARTLFRRCIHNEEFEATLGWLLEEGPEVQAMLDRLEAGERPLHWE